MFVPLTLPYDIHDNATHYTSTRCYDLGDFGRLIAAFDISRNLIKSKGFECLGFWRLSYF